MWKQSSVKRSSYSGRWNLTDCLCAFLFVRMLAQVYELTSAGLLLGKMAFSDLREGYKLNPISAV